jgi:hypothetical protein
LPAHVDVPDVLNASVPLDSFGGIDRFLRQDLSAPAAMRSSFFSAISDGSTGRPPGCNATSSAPARPTDGLEFARTDDQQSRRPLLRLLDACTPGSGKACKKPV